MRIDNYSFGTITIDGRTFTSDVDIYPDHVNASWWRKEGHVLETMDALSRQNIEVRVERTPEAVRLFNDAPEDKKVIALYKKHGLKAEEALCKRALKRLEQRPK